MKKNTKSKKDYSIHAIGHAHIDPVWQWNVQEGYQEVFATFRSALDRMKEFPDVCFVASSAQFYEWVAEAEPDMFEEIVTRVQEGRWVPVGGWWVECDINCATGESLVRQGLYAQKFFEKHLGRKARIGFSPDTFGHAWTVPQIIKKQGMDAYFYMRPELHENDSLPGPLFQWQGPDNSKVLAIVIVSAYNASQHDIEDRIDEYITYFSRKLPQIKDIALFYGVGNHGGGPTIATIRKIEEMQCTDTPGLLFASPEKYVDKIMVHKDKLPVFDQGIQYHARGCYSAHAGIKMWNRLSCAALISAEKVASLAHIIGHCKYPMNAFQTAWKKMLFNQFHDILAGTSIEEAYQDAHNDFGYVMTVANDITMKTMRALISEIDTTCHENPLAIPFIVFNPCSWQVKQYIEFEADILDWSTAEAERTMLRNSAGEPFPKNQIVLRDADGKVVPYQMLGTAAVKQENVPFRFRFLFEANVPAVGYQVYSFDFSKKENPPQLTGLTASVDSLENGMVRIQFDKKSGAITSYFDKRLNRELLSTPAAIPVALDDWDDTWGHKIQAYDRELGRFGYASLKLIETGPERARIEIRTRWGESFIVQTFSLYRNSAHLECSITIDWHEKYRVLKLSFPTVLNNGRCTYSIPYGFIERPMNGDEEPGQEWVDVSSMNELNQFGFAVINDSKCGYSVKDGDIRITVFHSTAWSHHNPEVVTEEDHCRYMEQGIHEFKYKLVPHAGDWRQANIPRLGEEFLSLPMLFHTSVHHGELPQQKSMITTDLENVSITAIKKAEDADGLILRCVELYGIEGNGTIEIAPLQRRIPVELNPCEIKTLFVPFDSQQDYREVNLIEE